MSLINQMLKDLESRRNPAPGAQELLEGHPGEAAGTRNRKLALILSLLVALLALIIAYLVWQRSALPAASAPREPAATIAAVQVKPTTPPRPDNVRLQSPPAGTAAPVAPRPLVMPAQTTAAEEIPPRQSAALTGEDASRHPRTAAKEHVAQPKAPMSAKDNTDADEEATAPAATIEKRIRPLRPEQLADRAYQEGYLLLQRGDRAGAERRWREALDHDPRHVASREGLAGLYLSQGRHVEAGELLAEGLRHHPGHGQFALLHARLQLQNGQPDAAIATLEQALANQTQGADFLAFLAALYQQQQAFDKSVAAYQKALSLQPGNGVWWMGIGISLEGAGKSKEALTAYGEAKKRGLAPKLLQYVEGRIGALQEK